MGVTEKTKSHDAKRGGGLKGDRGRARSPVPRKRPARGLQKGGVVRV